MHALHSLAWTGVRLKNTPTEKYKDFRVAGEKFGMKITRYLVSHTSRTTCSTFIFIRSTCSPGEHGHVKLLHVEIRLDLIT